MYSLESIKPQLKLPIIIAPMFLISNPNMVIKSCEQGVIGSFPALNARTNAELINWMRYIKSELNEFQKRTEENPAPWAINFICHRTNKRYEEDLQAISELQPPIVITSLGDPSPVVKIVHAYGGLVFSDVINVSFAKKAIEKGTDGLILVSAGAGGHGGELNPISFLNEVRSFWDGPVVLAGGISEGKDILAAQVLGADLVYMGSKFIVAEESDAEDEYKQMIIDSSIEDIIYTNYFSGISANYLIPSIENAGIDLVEIKNGMKDKNELKRIGVRTWKDIWGAGQGIGPIQKIEQIEEIINELTVTYHDEAKDLGKKWRGNYVSKS